MTTQRAANGVRNGHNGFHSDSEPESPTSDITDSSDTSSIAEPVNGITNGTSNLKLNPRRRMKRKQSSPMMPAFMVSAPGKVIMYGEHAVVHKKVSAHGRESREQRGTDEDRR
jgi:mevalonate kinase